MKIKTFLSVCGIFVCGAFTAANAVDVTFKLSNDMTAQGHSGGATQYFNVSLRGSKTHACRINWNQSQCTMKGVSGGGANMGHFAYLVDVVWTTSASPTPTNTIGKLSFWMKQNKYNSDINIPVGDLTVNVPSTRSLPGNPNNPYQIYLTSSKEVDTYGTASKPSSINHAKSLHQLGSFRYADTITIPALAGYYTASLLRKQDGISNNLAQYGSLYDSVSPTESKVVCVGQGTKTVIDIADDPRTISIDNNAL